MGALASLLIKNGGRTPPCFWLIVFGYSLGYDFHRDLPPFPSVLMLVLNKLVDKGNTVLIIEHNLDVVKMVDYLIDIGPEGGKGGGKVVAKGTPEEIIKVKSSHTAAFLKRELESVKK